MTPSEEPADPRALEGDGLELGARLAAHAHRLKLYLAHLAGPAVRRRVDLDDLVQEVFVRVVTAGRVPPAVATSTGAVEPELWSLLSVVARHVVVDVARASRAAKRAAARPDERIAAPGESTGAGLAASALAASMTGPATAVLRREASRDLCAAFDRLPPEHRRVLGLRQFAGLSAAECAARMGRSEAAVHSLYRRALAAWGEALGGAPGP